MTLEPVSGNHDVHRIYVVCVLSPTTGQMENITVLSLKQSAQMCKRENPAPFLFQVMICVVPMYIEVSVLNKEKYFTKPK